MFPRSSSSSPEGDRDICADLEAHFTRMLTASWFAQDPFCDETRRIPTTLEMYIGPTAEIATFNISVPLDEAADDSTRYEPSISSSTTTASWPRKSSERRASADALYVDGQPTTLSAAEHATRSAHVLLGNKEAIWQYMRQTWGASVDRREFDDAIW